VQHDLVTNHVVPEAIATDTETQLPLAGRNAHQLSDVRATFQVERVRLEDFDCPEQALVHASGSLA
jgi:hypothetical protein